MKYIYLFGGAIGDSLVGVHLARSLAQYEPGKRVTLVSTRHNPFVEELAASLPFLSYHEILKEKPQTWRHLLWLMASPSAIFMFDPTDVPLPGWWNLIARLATWLPKSIEVHSQLIGHERPLAGKAKRLTVKAEDNLFSINVPRILEVWGIQTGVTIAPELPRVAGSPVDTPYIVFHFFAGAFRRSWPKEKVVPFLEEARKRFPDHAFVLTATSPEKDAAECMANSISNTYLCVDLGTHELMQYLSNADMVVGVASGVTHLSSHLGVPTVALANLSDPYWLPSYAPRTRILANREECRCKGNKEGDCRVSISGGEIFRCLYFISTETVIDAMKSFSI